MALKGLLKPLRIALDLVTVESQLIFDCLRHHRKPVVLLLIKNAEELSICDQHTGESLQQISQRVCPEWKQELSKMLMLRRAAVRQESLACLWNKFFEQWYNFYSNIQE